MLRAHGGELGRQAADHIENMEGWLQSETKLVKYYAKLLAAAREGLARQVHIIDELKRGRVITWWRGNDTGVACTVQALAARMNDPRLNDGVFGYKPLQQLWERIAEGLERIAELEKSTQQKQGAYYRLADDLVAAQKRNEGLFAREKEAMDQSAEQSRNEGLRVQRLVDRVKELEGDLCVARQWSAHRVAELEKGLDEAHGTVREKVENCCQLKTRIAELEGDLCIARQWSAHRVAELEVEVLHLRDHVQMILKDPYGSRVQYLAEQALKSSVDKDGGTVHIVDASG
jgi:DNA repair exonuclease SbcCD ATPase subunit